MTKKAEALARELISLSQKYSDRDFVTALDLINSGDLFRPMMLLASEIKSKRVARPNDAPRTLSKKLAPLNYDDLLSRLPMDEQQPINDLIGKVTKAELLPTSANLREFSSEIGLELPKKLPPRYTLGRRLAQRILTLSQDERKKVFEAAERRSTGENTLKLWSDLIVRRDR